MSTSGLSGIGVVSGGGAGWTRIMRGGGADAGGTLSDAVRAGPSEPGPTKVVSTASAEEVQAEGPGPGRQGRFWPESGEMLDITAGGSSLTRRSLLVVGSNATSEYLEEFRLFRRPGIKTKRVDFRTCTMLGQKE